MKSLKIAGFVVGALAVLAVLAVTVALSSAVQTWAVRKAVAGQPGMTIEVARVEAGISTAQITGLRVAQDGLVVTAGSVSTRHSAWAYLTGRRIDVEELVVKDLFLDLRPTPPATPPKAGTTTLAGTPPAAGTGKPATPTATTPAKPASAKARFEGLLKQARLPFDVRVGRIAANGKATLPDQQQVVFEIKGSGLETGQRGRLEWTVDFSDSKTGAPIRAVRSTGTVQVSLTRDRRVDSVEIDTIAAAMGPNIPTDQIKLIAKAAQPVANGDEDYSAGLSLIRGGKTEPLLTASARFAAAPREISGTWEIALRSEQLAALLAGFGLPEIAATGAGKFSVKPDAPAASASGSLSASATQLQKLSPTLANVGTVNLKSSFDGSLAETAANLNSFEVELADGAGRRFAQINLLQKVSYRLADRQITLANSKAEAARVTLQAVPLAWAQPLAKPMTIESGDLSLTLAIEGEPDGSRVRARAVEPLTLRRVTIRDAQKKALVENITLTTRPSIDYTTTKLSAQLTELTLAMTTGDALSGTVSAEVTNLATKPATAFRVQLQAKLVTLLQPFVSFDPGPLTATVEAEGRHEGDSLQLTKAGAIVNRAGGALLAGFELQQPIRADLKAATFAATNPAAIAARIRVGEIPLAWAEPYVAKSKLAGTLAGATVEVTMRSIDDLSINTPEPIALRGISATLDGQALVQTLDVTASLTATKRKDTFAYDLRRLEVKQGATSLATCSAAGEAKLGAKTAQATAKGTLEADLVALMNQPALAPFATLKSGRFATAFEVSAGDTTQAKAVISVKSLVAKQDNRALGDIDLTLTASLKPDGSGTITAPLTLATATRKSDVSIAGTFGTASDKKTLLFTGKIASTNLVVDDLQALAALAPASQPAAAPGRSPTTVVRAPRPGAPTPGTTPAIGGQTKRDTQPFWKGANGKVEVDLKRILYGKDYVISAVRGTAIVTDTKLSLEGLEGRFKENPFKLAGGLTFAAQLPQPYALSASADVKNFDVGEFLRATSPEEKPALETKATVSAKLAGNGGTVGDLAMNAYGKFELSGSQGVMNLLARKGGASQLANIASVGLAIFGAARGSDTTVAIGELTRMLDRVPFDSMKLQVERSADLTFKLTSMEVLSPVLRLTGTGGIAAKSTDDIQNAPMNIVLQLGAKSELAQVLQRIGQLTNNKDEKGYYLMSRTFTIGGTPAKPDNSALWKLLLEAGVGAFLR